MPPRMKELPRTPRCTGHLIGVVRHSRIRGSNNYHHVGQVAPPHGQLNDRSNGRMLDGGVEFAIGMQRITFLNQHDSSSPFAPVALGGYRQYVEVAGISRMLFVSGQIGQTKEGDIPLSGYEQCRLAWINVLHQLKAAEYTIDQLVKATAYLTSAELIQSHQRARNELLGPRQPALSVIVVSQLADPRWHVEIEVVAAR